MKNIVILIALAVLIAIVYRQFSAQPEQATQYDEAMQEQAAPQAAADAAPETPSKVDSPLISPAAEGAEVFIISPKNGELVSSPVTVKFGIKNMTVAKAGDNQEFSGHHHLLINLEELPDMTVPLPATDKIVHFGGAQTETSIELEPGMHSLQLLLGNYLHIPHDKPILSKEIAIIVK